MNKDSMKYASPFDRKARLYGGIFAVAFHATLLGITSHAGFKYIYPPPPEQGILLEFIEEEQPKPIQVQSGRQPRAVEATPKEDVRLVQRSEAQLEGIAENRGVETTMGNQGDVALPEPERKKEINRRALFSSAKNKQDSLAAQVAETVSDALTAGHSQGNTEVGNVEGAPQAQLKGRSVMGDLPLPQYVSEVSGKVVVTIRVDQYGKVLSAIPGAKGTTLQDKATWEAAKKAALDAKFNIASNAPTVQEGTITYVFQLK
jgi:hypothetical protein